MQKQFTEDFPPACSAYLCTLFPLRKAKSAISLFTEIPYELCEKVLNLCEKDLNF